MKKPQPERGEQLSKNTESLSSTFSDGIDPDSDEEERVEEGSSDGESPMSAASAELLVIRQGLGDQDTVGAENVPSVQDQDDDTPAGNGVKDLVDYLPCPQCRAEHKIGPNGVDGFLTDYIAGSHLKEQEASSISATRTLTCDGCESSEPVVAFCDTCFEYLCDFCSNAHKRLKKFMDHSVKDLADLDEVFKEDIPSHKPSALYLCLQHPSEIIQLYCLECDAVVCNKCIVSSEHRGHEFTEIDSRTRKEVDDKLISLSTTVDKELKLQIDNLDYVKKVEKVTSDMASELQEKINYTFDSYAAELEARRTELLAESESKCSTKMKILWSERDSLERTIADMTTTQNFTKQVRQCKNNKEFLQLTSQVLPRLRKLESWEWSYESVDEVERYSLDIEESDVTVDLISEACFLEEDQLPHYTVEFSEFDTSANLDKEHSFMIHITPGKCCRPWAYIETPTVELKHVRSETCDVADISITSTDYDSLDFIRLLQPEAFESMNDKEKWELTNTWRVTYTPYCGGGGGGSHVNDKH